MTPTSVDIRRATTLSPDEVEQLAATLVAVVGQGASVGYLPPLDIETARNYWRGAVQPLIDLVVAKVDGRTAGTVQLESSPKKNAHHRAEVNKLLVHPELQRHGIGRRLMSEVEHIARESGKTLLHLDTREGDVSNDFYRSLGWIEAGRIPMWAESASGSLDGTVFYYKILA
jgi:ribosomal protein S18 acetylase RimI-like enzyme